MHWSLKLTNADLIEPHEQFPFLRGQITIRKLHVADVDSGLDNCAENVQDDLQNVNMLIFAM